MRAAPSTMSSGGWKRCSAVFRAAISDRILVGDPAGVDAVHVDAVAVVVGRRGARHHVERGLRHVRVRVAGRLEVPVELPFHRRHVDDVLVALGRAQHQRLEPRVDDERRDGVDQLHLQQLHRRHLGQQQPPRVAAAQVHLLQVLVELPLREEVALRLALVGQQRDLRQLRRRASARDARQTPEAVTSALAGLGQHVVAAQPFVCAEQLAHVLRHVASAAVSPAIMCA